MSELPEPQPTNLLCPIHKEICTYFSIEKDCQLSTRFACPKCLLQPTSDQPTHFQHQVIEIQELNRLKNQKVDELKNQFYGIKTEENQIIIAPKTKIPSPESIKSQKVLAETEIRTRFSEIRTNFLEFLETQEAKLLKQYYQYHEFYVGEEQDNQQAQESQKIVENAYQEYEKEFEQEKELKKESPQEQEIQDNLDFINVEVEKLFELDTTGLQKFYNIVLDNNPDVKTQAELEQPAEKKYKQAIQDHAKSKKYQKIDQLFQKIDQYTDDWQKFCSDNITSTVFQNKEEIKIGTIKIRAQHTVYLHPQYQNYPQSKIEFLNQNIVLYSNQVRGSHPPIYQLSRLHLSTQFQENMYSFDREILDYCTIDDSTVLMGLSRFDQIYLYEPDPQKDFNPDNFKPAINEQQQQPPQQQQLIPFQLHLFANKLSQQCFNPVFNTSGLWKVSEQQFIVAQNCQYSNRNDTGYLRFLDVLALINIRENEQNGQRQMWKALEYESFSGRLQKLTFLSDKQRFICFYNQKSSQYYENTFDNYIRIFSVNSQQPQKQICIAQDNQIGQITCFEQITDSVYVVGSYVEFFLIQIDEASETAHILDKKSSTSSIYKIMKYKKNKFCFYDGYKTQFWKIEDEQMFEDNVHIEPALLNEKQQFAGEEKIISINHIINEEYNYLVLNQWDEHQLKNEIQEQDIKGIVNGQQEQQQLQQQEKVEQEQAKEVVEEEEKTQTELQPQEQQQQQEQEQQQQTA